MHPKSSKTKAPLSKNTSGYWQRKVFREEKFEPSCASEIQSLQTGRKPVWVSPTYYVRMQVGDVRRKMRLDATTAEEAGREAAKLYRDILGNGWPKTKVATQSRTEEALSNQTSIGIWIDAAIANSEVRPTTASKYGESLRTIIGDILGLSKSRSAEHRKQIDEFALERLTVESIRTWINKRVATAGKDVVKLRRAKNTIRALIANSKALFTPTLQERMGISDGNFLEPFRGVKLPTKSNVRYSSQFDAKLLLEAASRELGTVDSTEEGSSERFEQWKILYLALVAGLRYREIDNLRVRDVSPENRRISIRSHGEYQPKTLSSEADVTVSEHAGSVLKNMLKRTRGDWFISESKSSKSPQYRTGAHHDALLGWLRNYEERGIKPLAESHKPLHELRKEAGTLVNSQFGLNEAKTFLRHSSITTTAAYYLGSKGEITTGLG